MKHGKGDLAQTPEVLKSASWEATLFLFYDTFPCEFSGPPRAQIWGTHLVLYH